MISAKPLRSWPYTYTCTHSRPHPHTGEHGLLSLPPGSTTPAWGNSDQDDAPPSQSKPAAFFCVTIYLLSFSNVPPTPPSAILPPSLRSPAPSRPFPVLFRPPPSGACSPHPPHSLGEPPRGSPALVARPSAPRTRTQGPVPSQTRAQPLP